MSTDHTHTKKTDLVMMVLGMVIDKDLPARALVDALSIDEQQQITRWCRAMHEEAQTDPEFLADHTDCKATAAPECLLRIMSKDHYLQTWRR